MTKPHIAFAVPGKITTLTGGYIYDRRVMHELRDLGWTVDHIALPAGFPDPSPQQMRTALDLLQAIPADRPVIIDGLAYGALDPTGVAKIKAPIVALVHHPLARQSAGRIWRRSHQNHHRETRHRSAENTTNTNAAAADPICRHPTAAQRTRRFAAGLGADHRSGLALRHRGNGT